MCIKRDKSFNLSDFYHYLMTREVCINFSHLSGGGSFQSSVRGRQFSVICQWEAVFSHLSRGGNPGRF